MTLFHYRNHGTDVGKVLAGVALPASLSGAEQDAAWEGFLTTVGYTY
eukprot:COSAG01_NODE_71354_length_256_cov_0.656051_1_plen_46_part_10